MARRIFPIIFGAFLVMAALFVSEARAAELLMYKSPLCPWCKAWEKDIGSFYGKTDEAKMLPLRRLDIKKPVPKNLAYVKGVVYTPTFVVVDGKREVGRIVGYVSEDFFWGYLDGLMKKLHKIKKRK
ncbi:MAG TPA: thioredoxin family protein [Alphaproteobacteria bacterium]|nr:thioredoxin family protein [Alphaproteobacteria bacterium]